MSFTFIGIAILVRSAATEYIFICYLYILYIAVVVVVVMKTVDLVNIDNRVNIYNAIPR
jgi:hypothetical protein